jgi:hypothetical protein
MNRRSDNGEDLGSQQSLTLQFDEFAWKAMEEQAAQLGVSVDEFATFAVLYYLADLDSGRIARRVPPLERS